MKIIMIDDKKIEAAKVMRFGKVTCFQMSPMIVLTE